MAPIGVEIFSRAGTEPAPSLSYDYRDTIRPWDIVCQTVCLSISTMLLFMRCFTKFYVLRSPGWEDYSCITAWMGLIAYIIVTFEADKVGSGIHQNEVAPSDLVRYAQLANYSQIIYGPLIFITKLSILLLYVRAFSPAKNTKTFFIVHLILWSNLLFYTAHTLVEIFECNPREKIWDHTVAGTCVNVDVLILVTAVLNVISDFSLLLLPIVAVWRLQLRKSQKWGITAIFGAGLFGCISSVMRLSVSANTADTTDKTYDWFSEFLWTSAEISSGLIASCLPAIPTFFRYFRNEGILSSITGTHRHSRGITDISVKGKRKSLSNGLANVLPKGSLPSSVFKSSRGSDDSDEGGNELLSTATAASSHHYLRDGVIGGQQQHIMQQQALSPQTFLELEETQEWERTLAGRNTGRGAQTIRTECRAGSDSSIDLVIEGASEVLPADERRADRGGSEDSMGNRSRSRTPHQHHHQFPVSLQPGDQIPWNGIVKTVQLDFRTSMDVKRDKEG